jgi:hypothetical protein
MYGDTCYYCGEPASCIDHIIPISYGGNNDIGNLVLSCSWCNLLAGSTVFDDLDDKFEYIRRQRMKKRKHRHAICSACLLPFEYRLASPSLFLCAECYDDNEGDTAYSQRRIWKDWIALLEEAGIPVEAHRTIRNYKTKSRPRKFYNLVQVAYYGQ